MSTRIVLEQLIRFAHDSYRDVRFLLDALLNRGGTFAFLRFSPDEIRFLNKRHRNDWEKSIARGIREALRHSGQNYYVGLPKRCCSSVEIEEKAKKLVGVGEKQQTFETIWDRESNVVGSCLSIDVVMVGNSPLADVYVPLNVTDQPFNFLKVVKEMESIDRPIYVHDGLLSNVLIYYYWLNMPNRKRQPIINIGSRINKILRIGGPRVLDHECVW